MQPIIRFDEFEVDPIRHVLTRDGIPVVLRPKSFSLLWLLLAQRQRIVSKEEILRHLWPDGSGTEANLTVNIAAVRRALDEHPRDHRYVVTIPTVGYRFVGRIHTGHGTTPGDRPADSWRSIGIAPFMLESEPGAATKPGLAIPTEDLVGFVTSTQHQLVRALKEVPELEVCRLDGRPGVILADGSLADAPVAEIDAILGGTLRRHGNEVRVDVSIWLRDDGRRVWNGRIVHPQSELPILWLRLTRMVLNGLRPSIMFGPQSSRYTANEEAMQAYFEGSYHFWSGKLEDSLDRSLRCFERAVEADPDYAAAYAGLSEILIYRLSTAAQGGSPEQNQRVISLAEHAVELAPLCAVAHRSLGLARMGLEWNWVAAREHLLASIDFDPQDAMSHDRYAFYLAARGQVEAALDAMRRAQETDPLSIRLQAHLARMHLYLGNFDAARTIADDLFGVEGSSEAAMLLSSWLEICLGSPTVAVRECEAFANAFPGERYVIAMLATARARAGDDRSALSLLEEFEYRRRDGESIPATSSAQLHLAMGNLDDAFEWAMLACDERYPYAPFYHIDPFWRQLKEHSRYPELHARIFGDASI